MLPSVPMKRIWRVSSGILGIALIATGLISAQARANHPARTFERFVKPGEAGRESPGVSVGDLNTRLHNKILLDEGKGPFVTANSGVSPAWFLIAQLSGEENAKAFNSPTEGLPGLHRDPCQSRMRCSFLTTIMQAKDVKVLNSAYRSGCQGFSEQALRALRLYQLDPAQGTRALLNSMPRGIGDSMSFLWMTTAGVAETVGDIQYFYNAVYPFDELPSTGCYHGGLDNDGKYLTEYYSSLANAVMENPRYMPAFLAVSQLFGYKKDWNDLNKEHGYCQIDIDKLFTRLLLSLYTKDKKTFREYSGWTKFGKAAFDQAEDEAIRIMILKMKQKFK